MVTTQQLHDLTINLVPDWRMVDRDKPHYYLSARTDGPWVTLIVTNDFAWFVNGYTCLHTLLRGKGVILRAEYCMAVDTVYLLDEITT